MVHCTVLSWIRSAEEQEELYRPKMASVMLTAMHRHISGTLRSSLYLLLPQFELKSVPLPGILSVHIHVQSLPCFSLCQHISLLKPFLDFST